MDNTSTNISRVCSEVLPYSGEIYEELFKSLEIYAEGVELLDCLNDTLQTSRVVHEFMCHRISGLCDNSGNINVNSAGSCLRVNHSLCSEQWRRALSFLPPETLPVCNDESTGMWLFYRLILFHLIYLL